MGKGARRFREEGRQWGQQTLKRIFRNRCQTTIEPPAPEQEPITATQEHQERRGGAECFSVTGRMVSSQRATTGLWCGCVCLCALVCIWARGHGSPPNLPITSNQRATSLACLSPCTLMSYVPRVGRMTSCTFVSVSTCMQTFPLSRLHVHVTLEWLLQLQPTGRGVYLVDSGEGPNGPGRWRSQAGRQARTGATLRQSTASSAGAWRELDMRYDCKGYMPVFLKRSWTVLGSNVWKPRTVVRKKSKEERRKTDKKKKRDASKHSHRVSSHVQNTAMQTDPI